MKPDLQYTRSLDNLPDFFSMADFAAVFGVSRATAYRMAEQGKLPHLRIGKRIILSRGHLKQWIDAQMGSLQ